MAAAFSQSSVMTEEEGSGHPRKPLISHWAEVGHKLILKQSWTRELRVFLVHRGPPLEQQVPRGICLSSIFSSK